MLLGLAAGLGGAAFTLCRRPYGRSVCVSPDIADGRVYFLSGRSLLIPIGVCGLLPCAVCIRLKLPRSPSRGWPCLTKFRTGIGAAARTDATREERIEIPKHLWFYDDFL